MANKKISQLDAVASILGTELIEVSKASLTVTRTATTISALASDNSYNDSGAGFVSAGFALGDQIGVVGFTGNVVNNIVSGRITALTTGKMTIGGAEGNVIVDDAAGESVTIFKWESRRATAAQFTGAGVTGPGSSVDNTLARWNGTGGSSVQGSGVVLTDDDELSGYKANLNQQTGTTYTLVAADTGKIVELSNASAIALTIPNNLPKGFACTVVQGGVGQVTMASTGSGTLVNRQSHTKTAGQNGMVTLYVRSNSGTNAVWVLGGDTAA